MAHITTETRLNISLIENHFNSAGEIMDTAIQTQINNIRSEDGAVQNKAYFYILEKTDKPVNWAYDVWDEMIDGLSYHEHERIRP